MIVKEISYYRAIEKVTEVCVNKFSDEIVSVFLGGSVARGDFSPGRSDIDLYFVLTSRNDEIESNIESELKNIENEYLPEVQKFNVEPVSSAFTSKAEVLEGKSFLGAGFEYHNFIRDGKLLYGLEIRNLIPEPKREKEFAMADNYIQTLKKVYDTAQDQGIAKCFSFVFRTACIFLSGKGLYVSSKKDVVAFFKNHFSKEEDLNNNLFEVYNLWLIWGDRSLKEEEIYSLTKSYNEVMSLIFDLWERERKNQNDFA